MLTQSHLFILAFYQLTGSKLYCVVRLILSDRNRTTTGHCRNYLALNYEWN